MNVARGARWGFCGVLRRGKKLPAGNIGYWVVNLGCRDQSRWPFGRCVIRNGSRYT